MSINVGQIGSGLPEQDLVVGQRQAMLGSLSGIIAHEYNNLMTPVLARAQDAIARNDVEGMRKALATTARQTEKALDFTRHVLELAQGAEAPVETHRVVDLTRAALTSAVRPFEKDGIEIELHIPEELQVRAQPLLFEQVMLNLLLNARKAMKKRRGKLSISAHRNGEMVRISVCDRGVGMSREMLDEVVNPFLEADANAKPGDWSAVGLGLHACRTIAQFHGASLRATANDGPGVTFHLSWPAA